MAQDRMHSDALRHRVIALFFLGLLLMAIFAVLIGYLSADWGSFQFGWWNRIVGAVLFVVGLALVLWSVRIQYVIGKGTPAPKVPTTVLITQGPYAYTRNPMTLGALLLYLGIGIWMRSAAVVILTGLVFSGLLAFIYMHETRELSERFGDEYLAYRKRTPFFIPFCRFLH